MASGALFGNASSRNKSKNLVEFKAGKMYLKGKMCHADKRKGLLYVYQADDSLMHFCWKDRTTGNVDDDLIIFPDDIEFKNVPQCTTGRVYVLKFKSSSRKYIFWMQEAKDDKDDENCRKVNDALNNPPTPSASRAGGGLAGLPADLASLTGDNDLQSILGSMSQQQLLQLLGGMSGGGSGGLTSALARSGRPVSSSQASSAEEATTPLSIRSSPGPQARSAADGSESVQPRPATVAALPSQGTGGTPVLPGAATGSLRAAAARPLTQPGSSLPSHTPAVQLSDLQDILANVNMAATVATQERLPSSTALANALSSNRMLHVLADSLVQQKLKDFAAPGILIPTSEEGLRELVPTPVFQEIAHAFRSALTSRQFLSLFEAFDLPEAAVQAANQGDIEAFIKALDEPMPEDSDMKMDEN